MRSLTAEIFQSERDPMIGASDELRRECETDVIHQTFAKHYAELFNQDVVARCRQMLPERRLTEHKSASIDALPPEIFGVQHGPLKEIHRHAVETGLGRCGAHDLDFLLTHVL